MKRTWRVILIDMKRARLVMRARNTETGKVLSRTCSSDRKKDCTREAGEWEAKLNAEGHVQSPRFSQAREKFEAEYLPSRRQSTGARFGTVFNAFSQVIGDPKLDSISESTISDFSKSYGSAVSPASLAAALRHLKAFFRWANRQRLMARVPHIEMPKAINKAKGRALTGEEFDRVLSKIAEIRPSDGRAWAYLMRGLWASGLRLGEALALSWDDQAAVAVVAMETGRPRIRFQPEAQKSGKLQECPVTPDFAKLLRETPEEHRRGRVFKCSTRRVDNASGTITQFCRAAGVKGSAHDFRRSFATRWARVLPAQALQRLMRHSSLQTTLTFYVGDIGLEDQLWADFGNKTGNTPVQPTEGKTPNTLENKGENEWGCWDLNPEPTDYES
jgi:integrase